MRKGVERFQSFHYDIKNIEGVNFNARYVDRFFLTRLTKEEWIAMAEELLERNKGTF